MICGDEAKLPLPDTIVSQRDSDDCQMGFEAFFSKPYCGRDQLAAQLCFRICLACLLGLVLRDHPRSWAAPRRWHY